MSDMFITMSQIDMILLPLDVHPHGVSMLQAPQPARAEASTMNILSIYSKKTMLSTISYKKAVHFIRELRRSNIPRLASNVCKATVRSIRVEDTSGVELTE